MGQKLLAAYARLLEGIGTGVALAYLAAALLMALDIGIRAAGLGALPWLLELTEYLLYAGTFLAAPWALRKGAHVCMDLFATAVPAPWGRRVEVVADLSGAAVSIVLVVFGAAAVAEAWRDNTIQFKTWATPEWLLLLPIPLAGLLLALEFALRIARVAAVLPGAGAPRSRAAI